MYVCLCKGLTDSDVRLLARTLADSGVKSIESFLAFLDLDNISVCGLCAEQPEQLISLAMSEWTPIERENLDQGQQLNPT
jgi:bacterioferritin-associated ferredoxin